VSASLERGHRRLLALYPPEHRATYGAEMLGTLMAAAPAGRRRPGLATGVDLVRGAATAWGRRLNGSAELAAAGVLALAAMCWVSVEAVMIVTTHEINSSYGRPGMAAMWFPSFVWLPVTLAALWGFLRSARAVAWSLGIALPFAGEIVTGWFGHLPGYIGGFYGGLLGSPWGWVALLATAALTWTGGPRAGLRALARAGRGGRDGRGGRRDPGRAGT
jgi:hypothetical protein